MSVWFSMFSYVVNPRGPAVFVACTKRAKPAGGEKCAFLTRNKALFALESATEWTASVHTWTHVQSCNVNRVQSATEWTASVHTLI